MNDEVLRELEREALAGDRDALERLVRARVQLETTKFVRCWLCDGRVQREQWQAHHAACGIVKKNPRSGGETPPSASSGGISIVPLPMQGPVAARPWKEPLWSRAVLGQGSTEANFFMHGDPSHSNLGAVNGPCIPRNEHFFAFGVALVPDAGSSPAAVLAAWNDGTFWFGTSRTIEWPARLVMADPEDQPRALGAVVAGLAWPRAMLTIKGKPFEVLCLERIQSGFRVPRALSEPLGLMAVLYGIRLKALTA